MWTDGDYRCFALLKNIDTRRTDGLRTAQNDMAVRYHCETTSNEGSNDSSIEQQQFPLLCTVTSL
jgi:hypothetical protein